MSTHILLITHLLSAQILITEVERNPLGLESDIPGGKSHEYIELVNMGDDTFYIDSLILTDGDVENSLIPVAQNISYIAPGDIALVLDPDYFTAPQSSLYSLPESVLLLKVNHSSICGGLTEEDGFVFLYGKEQKVVASFTNKEFDPTENEKLTFIVTGLKDSDSTSLSLLSQNSLNYVETKPTPGYFNAMHRGYYWETDANVIDDYQFSLQIVFKPFQRNPICVELKNRGDVLWNYKAAVPFAFDTVLTLDILPEEYLFHFTENDEQFTESLDLTSIIIESNSIFISEVAPRSRIEWLEIVNQGSRSLSLDGWYLIIGDDTVNITEGSIPKDSFTLISSRNEFLFTPYVEVVSRMTMNNYADAVKLYSPLGLVDSICWESNTFAIWDKESVNRRSKSSQLELCRPSPGEVSTCLNTQSTYSLEVSPKVLTPNGDGDSDNLSIEVGNKYGVEYTLSLVALSGELLYTHSLNEPDTVIWDCLDRYGRLADRGPVFIILEVDGVQIRREAVLWH